MNDLVMLDAAYTGLMVSAEAAEYWLNRVYQPRRFVEDLIVLLPAHWGALRTRETRFNMNRHPWSQSVLTAFFRVDFHVYWQKFDRVDAVNENPYRMKLSRRMDPMETARQKIWEMLEPLEIQFEDLP